LQTARLNAAGLTGNDAQAAIGILATFKTNYADLVASYNQASSSAERGGQKPDQPKFLAERDALVRTALDALKLGLTQEGTRNLGTYVRREKHHMKISKEIQ
jgi:hypothetical protein